MLCFKQVAGWPVIDSEGKEVGRVEQLVITEDLQLTGVMVASTKDGLALASIEDIEFGDHLLWLTSGSCFKCAPNGEHSTYSLMMGKEILDISGHVSGIAHDFVLDPTRKLVSGMEMSNGLVLDWLQGRPVLETGCLQFDGQHWITAKDNKDNKEGAGIKQ